MLCFTYVRGPDLKAGLHFSIRAQVGNSSLVWLCVRLPGSARVGARAPTLPHTRSFTVHLVSGETVKGTCVRRKRTLDSGRSSPLCFTTHFTQETNSVLRDTLSQRCIATYFFCNRWTEITQERKFGLFISLTVATASKNTMWTRTRGSSIKDMTSS